MVQIYDEMKLSTFLFQRINLFPNPNTQTAVQKLPIPEFDVSQYIFLRNVCFVALRNKPLMYEECQLLKIELFNKNIAIFF